MKKISILQRYFFEHNYKQRRINLKKIAPKTNIDMIKNNTRQTLPEHKIVTIKKNSQTHKQMRKLSNLH